MIQRVCKTLLGGRRIVVLNDQTHHCYCAERDTTRLDALLALAPRDDGASPARLSA